MKRILYLLAMFTGVRAAFNCGRSYFLPKLRVAILDGNRLELEKYGSVRVRVNARPAPTALDSEAKAGMISLYMVSPGIPSLLYAFIRLTSHFGCGHVEIAFYETQDNVTLFAVRNILRSNIDRLKLNQMFGSLRFSSEDDEIVLLERVINKLNSLGFTASFASPDECVSLALIPSLLAPRQRNLATDSLRRKYRRIEKKLTRERNLRNVSNKHCGKLSYQVEKRQPATLRNPTIPIQSQRFS
jgi:hypothetical protein